MLVSMARVQIVGLRRDLEAVLSRLHDLGTLELVSLDPPRALAVGAIRKVAPDRERIAAVEAVADALGRLVAAAPRAAEPAGPGPPAPPLPGQSRPGLDAALAEASSLLQTLEPAYQRCAARRAALEAELVSLRRYQEVIQQLLPLAESLVELEGFESVALVLQPAYRFVLDALRDELARLTHQQCEVVSAETAEGGLAVLLVYSRRSAAEVRQLLQSEQLTEVRLPDAYRGRPLREVLREIARRLEEIPAELEALERELAALLAPRVSRLGELRQALLDGLDELVAAGQCLESDHAFVLGGWLPERELPALRRALAEAFGERVVVEQLPVGPAEREDMPVLLDNPPPVRPFEVLLRLLPPPRYGTIDPTPFLAFFFPFFFGLILGDIGYGLLAFGLGLWLQARPIGPPWVRQAGQVLSAGGSAAVVFGFAFGELFGDLGHRLGLRPLVAARSEAIQPLLLFSVAVGAVQVGLGLVLGVINGLLERHRKEALSRAGVLLALVAVFLLVGTVAELLPEGSLTPSLALLLVATALLLYSVGVAGPLEVFGVLGNILSYTRLVAVGIASAILAEVANQLAGRTGSLVAGAMVGALFHGLNLALGLFSPSIHSLRLQYVEFFGRFFQPGGRPYAPFRRRASV